MYSMTPMYKDRHMEEFKRVVMRHIKLINMNSRLFWIYLEVHEVVHEPCVQEQAHLNAPRGS
jgi:hypothetical protein